MLYNLPMVDGAEFFGMIEKYEMNPVVGHNEA